MASKPINIFRQAIKHLGQNKTEASNDAQNNSARKQYPVEEEDDNNNNNNNNNATSNNNNNNFNSQQQQTQPKTPFQVAHSQRKTIQNIIKPPVRGSSEQHAPVSAGGAQNSAHASVRVQQKDTKKSTQPLAVGGAAAARKPFADRSAGNNGQSPQGSAQIRDENDDENWDSAQRESVQGTDSEDHDNGRSYDAKRAQDDDSADRGTASRGKAPEKTHQPYQLINKPIKKLQLRENKKQFVRKVPITLLPPKPEEENDTKKLQVKKVPVVKSAIQISNFSFHSKGSTGNNGSGSRDTIKIITPVQYHAQPLKLVRRE